MKKLYQSLLAVAVPLTIAATSFVSISPSASSLPPLIPRQILFGNPERRKPLISPDGKYLSYLAPDRKGVMQIWIRTVGQQDDRMLTNDQKRGIQNYSWVYNGQQLIFEQDLNGDENWHLYTVDVKSKNVRDLTPYKGVQAQLVALDPSFPNEVLVALNSKAKQGFYRVNLRTGTAKLDTANPGNVIDAVKDDRFQIRAVTVATSDGGSQLLVREAINKPWRAVRKWSANDQGDALSFSRDGKTLYITASHNANATRLSALALATGKETVLAQDPQYDVFETLVHPVTDEVQAAGFYRDKLQWQVVDKSIAEDFAAIAKIHEGQFIITNRDLADKTWLISYTTDDGPIYVYSYDRTSKKGTFLFTNQPQLEGLSLASIKPISYRSRDGLTIHGYLTTPVGIPAKNLPTVLLVHGGPWERDIWGYAPMVQLLANRGYAVLQVNFRGSTGYGKKFLNAGNKEWGGEMQSDLTDGVNWIVKQGIADPKKIAIMGGSYGGYASLAGLTFTPNVFAAGLSLSGPSNLLTLLKSIPPSLEPMKQMFYHRVGNPQTEAEFLKSRSPLFFVDRIQSPLLVVQGANDPRVKQAESEQIVAAMRKANKPVEYLLFSDEGHDFVRPANNLFWTAKAEEFLGKHLGGRVEPMGKIPGHSAKIK